MPPVRALASRYPPPIPGTNIPVDKLPAGKASSPLLHFSVPDHWNPSSPALEVYLQQLARGHGTWTHRDEAPGPQPLHSDDFGFRLSVNGQLCAVQGVEVRVLEKVVWDADNAAKCAEPWHEIACGAWSEIVCDSIGMNGLREFELMFNANVLLPSVSALGVVQQVLSGRTGGRDLAMCVDPLSMERLGLVDKKFVRKRTGFLNGEWKVFGFCAMNLFFDRISSLWQFQLFIFRISVDEWPVAKLYEERMGFHRAPLPRRRLVDHVPAGQQSHLAFMMGVEGRRVELHQILRRSGEGDEDFGISFLLDGVRRVVTDVRMCMLEPDEDGVLTHFVYDTGVDTYKLIFNSELLEPGNEARVLDALLVRAMAMDRASVERVKFVLGGFYLPSVVGFNMKDSARRRGGGNGGIFTFCTCSAYVRKADSGACEQGMDACPSVWEFQVYEFDIHYGPKWQDV